MTVVPFPVRQRSSAASSVAPTVNLLAADPASATIMTLWGTCPWSDQLLEYDRRNIYLYARLLHDESEGASEDDLARDVLGLDPYRNRSRVKEIVRSHMRRARWIRETLFPMLGW